MNSGLGIPGIKEGFIVVLYFIRYNIKLNIEERIPWRNFAIIYSLLSMSVLLIKLSAWLWMEKPLHPIKKFIINIL